MKFGELMKRVDSNIDQEGFVDLSDSPKNKSRFLGLAIMIVLMASVTTGFANFNISNKDKVASPEVINAAANCSATPTRITFIVDHSSSVVNPAFGGSQANIDSILFGLQSTLNGSCCLIIFHGQLVEPLTGKRPCNRLKMKEK